MNKPFDPVLQAQFVQNFSVEQLTAVKSIQHPAELDDFLHQLRQPVNDESLMLHAYGFIGDKLKEIQAHYSSAIFPQYEPQQWADLRLKDIQAIELTIPRQNLVNQLVQQTAEMHVQAAYCLQNCFQISCSQSPLAMQVLDLFLKLQQKGRQTITLAERYQAMLSVSGKGAEQNQTNGAVQEMIIIQRALAHFPQLFFAEILGFTLASCQSPSIIEICFPHHQLRTDYFSQRQHYLQQHISAVQLCIEQYLASFPEQQSLIWQRVQAGFWLYQQQLQSCRDEYQQMFSQSVSIDQAIIDLFQQKAKAAIGHHHKIIIQGQSLDHWFADLSENPIAFLQALKQSAYVDQHHPANSRLLSLFEFSAPMFGVLNTAELQLLKQWLHSTALDAAVTVRGGENSWSQKRENRLKVSHYQGLSNRALYYFLLNADLFPDVYATAHSKVSRMLRLCRMVSRMPFKHYNAEKFDQYIDQLYQQEMAAYQPLHGKPKTSKAAYIWGIKQIAPMILIDGCWLQHSLTLEKCYPEIADILFSIYCDETGRGQLQQNHCYIFKQLLDSLLIKLPPAHSPEFVEQRDLINSSFDLPVYMLSLSCFSVEFLPELLGLNMAIELSGLGKGYMSLVDEWGYWGIDASIAEIHISIDNAASGHTFLAKKAIHLYMDKLMQETASPEIVDQHWQRICTGYMSLRLIAKRFSLSLPVHYLINKCF